MPENTSDMAPNDDDLAPVTDPAHAAAPPPPSCSAMPVGRRLRDRVFRLRSVLAVAAAGVIVGGAAGAGLTAVTIGNGDDRPHFGRNGFGPGQAPGMSGGMPGVPGMPGGQHMPGGQSMPSGQGMPGGQRA